MRHQVAYRDTASFDDELPRARDAQRAMADFAGRMLDDVRNGRPISQDDVRDAVEPMVRSILRNVDAFLWVDNLRARGSYEYEHALNCSALAAAFGAGRPPPPARFRRVTEPSTCGFSVRWRWRAARPASPEARRRAAVTLGVRDHGFVAACRACRVAGQTPGHRRRSARRTGLMGAGGLPGPVFRRPGP